MPNTLNKTEMYRLITRQIDKLTTLNRRLYTYQEIHDSPFAKSNLLVCPLCGTVTQDTYCHCDDND